MKTNLAVQKSEYSRCLMKYIGICSNDERRSAYFRMQQIEQEVKDLGDEIEIVITTKNTTNKYVAPAMTEENIKKNRNDKEPPMQD